MYINFSLLLCVRNDGGYRVQRHKENKGIIGKEIKSLLTVEKKRLDVN